MKISQTTLNFAKRRGIDLTVEDVDGWPILCFWDDQNDNEWMFSYRMSDDALHWGGNVWLADDVKEELPATITSDKHLRQVIEFLGSIPRSAW